MSTTTPTLIQMLIGAIPPEEGATLVARAGERARITSAAGSVEVGSVALTADAMDGLAAQLLPPEHLQSLRNTGALHVELVMPNGTDNFDVLATSSDSNRSIELRRRGPSTAARGLAAPPPKPPSEETLVAELLSRSFPRGASSSTPPTATHVASTPSTAQNATALPPSEIQTPFPPMAPPPAEDASGSSHDLDVPTNIEFPDANFELDALDVSGAFVEAPSNDTPPAAPLHVETTTPAPASVPQKRARLSILLPAAACLVIGIPAVGWFTWTQYWPTGHATAAPIVVTTPKPKPVPPAPPSKPQAAAAVAATTPTQPIEKPVADLAPQRSPEPPAPIDQKPPAHTMATASAPSRSGFSIQVAAVRDRGEAERRAATLAQRGYSSYVAIGQGAAADFFRVRIGPFPDRHAADEIAKQLEMSEGTTPWIVNESK
ncbi:MAG TPA: SPOR domain-containing protein [Vicinamibacterales bacterium]|nr:SPOR domain-containing protein [Vicinamibacterales bacterium]